MVAQVGLVVGQSSCCKSPSKAHHSFSSMHSHWAKQAAEYARQQGWEQGSGSGSGQYCCWRVPCGSDAHHSSPVMPSAQPRQLGESARQHTGGSGSGQYCCCWSPCGSAAHHSSPVRPSRQPRQSGVSALQHATGSSSRPGRTLSKSNRLLNSKRPLDWAAALVAPATHTSASNSTETFIVVVVVVVRSPLSLSLWLACVDRRTDSAASGLRKERGGLP
mmetsp:Transcript_11518/g.29746  ORF Transcript_11518/g.29746 Transcript_11518/m.29746 type:complete len:219 (+) Transcript_11518:448-1104(+)